MFRRTATWLTLACYGVIALFGQGLHLLVHDHAWTEIAAQDAGGDWALAEPVAHDAAAALGESVAPDESQVDSSQIVIAQHDADHDSEHCSICQHHSLGQVFLAAPPVEIELAVCELLSSPAPQTVVCPALFAVSQPRTPPAAA